MDDTMSIFSELQKELGHFLLSIMTNRFVDTKAFEKIDTHGKRLATTLKTSETLPKSILREIRSSIKILRAEAPYIAGEEQVINDMADRMEMTFDLILLGEDHSDRASGVPRII